MIWIDSLILTVCDDNKVNFITYSTLFGNLVKCYLFPASPNRLAGMASLNNRPFTRSIFSVGVDANLLDSALTIKVIFLE